MWILVALGAHAEADLSFGWNSNHFMPDGSEYVVRVAARMEDRDMTKELNF